MPRMALVVCLLVIAFPAGPARAAGGAYTSFDATTDGCTGTAPPALLAGGCDATSPVLRGSASDDEWADATGAFSVSDLASGGNPADPASARSVAAVGLDFRNDQAVNTVTVVASPQVDNLDATRPPAVQASGETDSGDARVLINLSLDGVSCPGGSSPISDGTALTITAAGDYGYYASISCPDGMIQPSSWHLGLSALGLAHSAHGSARADIDGSLGEVDVSFG
ncbi:MAG: hypothetical protein ACYDAY_02700 [Candidatus Dormibacteria bacterium]